MTKTDLLNADWVRTQTAYGDERWKHEEVFDGYLHTYAQAVEAERIRRTRDGG